MVEALQEFPDQVMIFDLENSRRSHWQQSFTSQGPLFVEVGTGKGKFLREMAQARPEIRFIGLEREPGILLQAVRLAKEQGLTNLKFILGDVQLLQEMFVPAEVDRLYIHFCDPWPKQRHAKRRLTHPDFLAAYATVLAPGGTVRLKTDNSGLFQYSLEMFAQAAMELVTVTDDLHAGDTEPGGIMTEYEAKFVAAGVPVHYCEARFGVMTQGRPDR
jgi:tRNA (guanine-N7-)-methyltransferase